MRHAASDGTSREIGPSAAGFSIDGFGGTIIAPDSSEYDEARAVFNGMIDRRPAVIARCGRVSDVVAVVDFARENSLPLSVYGGGHGVTGSAVVDAGVCLDMRGMRDVVIDPDAATARVGAGATWGEVDATSQEHGLAVTGGRGDGRLLAGHRRGRWPDRHAPVRGLDVAGHARPRTHGLRGGPDVISAR